MLKKVQKHLSKTLPVIALFAFAATFGFRFFTGNSDETNLGKSSASPVQPADINSDNYVNITDLSILLSRWGTNDNLADVNKDGDVDITDLSIVISKWGAVSNEPQTAVMPDRDNTGPRKTLASMTPAQFYSTRVCDGRRITGNVEINQQSMLGQTFSIVDCEITGSLSFYLIGGDRQLPAAQMPTINISYSDILGGVTSQHAVKLNVDHTYVFGRVQMKLTDGWPITTPGYAPYAFTNSLLYAPYATQPTHTETLQTAGYGTGTSFTNVVFMQQGGSLDNTGVTATVNYVGDGTVFDGCYFIWDGPTPAWYTAYISGPNVVVKNSWFDTGAASYIYPNSPNIMPTFSNNKNFRTKQPINLP